MSKLEPTADITGPAGPSINKGRAVALFPILDDNAWTEGACQGRSMFLLATIDAPLLDKDLLLLPPPTFLPCVVLQLELVLVVVPFSQTVASGVLVGGRVVVIVVVVVLPPPRLVLL